MVNERKALRKGQAHVEYLVLKSAIEELAKAGHNLKTIYEKFKAEGRISMSYQALHENMTRAERRKRRARMGDGGEVSRWRNAVAAEPSVLLVSPAPSLDNRPPSGPPRLGLKELEEEMAAAMARRGGASRKK